MKKLLSVMTIAAAVMVLSAEPTDATTEITVDHVNGLVGGDTVWAGSTVRFVLRLTYTPGDGSAIVSFTNAFKIWTHRYGTYTDNFSPIEFDTLPLGWDQMFSGGFFINPFGVDGIGTDTVAFVAFSCLFGGCINDGFDSLVWWIETMPYQPGDTLCLDSVTNFPPTNQWLWSTNGPLGTFPPDWGGPYCFHVEECCLGNRGNVDMEYHSGSPVDIADLVMLKDILFGSEVLPCIGAGDVNGSGIVDVADLTYLVDYLFRGGLEPLPCP